MSDLSFLAVETMKKNIIWCVSLLLLSIVIPMTAVIRFTDDSEKAKNDSFTPSDNSVVKLTEDDAEYIVSTVMEYVDEDSPKEAINAIIAICKNNYLYYMENDMSPDSVDISNYSDEFYLELSSMYEENRIEILYNNEHVYIPLTSLSGAHTSTSDEYPYMSAVASPWDVFSPDYNSDREYSCGVSMYGVKHICAEGGSAAEALRWYLPSFKITDTKK